MKKQCNNCPFYDADYNMYKQGCTIIIGEKIKQYCFLFENGIPKDILRNKRKCEYKEIAKFQRDVFEVQS